MNVVVQTMTNDNFIKEYSEEININDINDINDINNIYDNPHVPFI